MNEIKTKTSELEIAFVNALNRGVEAWREAGAVLVRLFEEDPEAISRLKTRLGVNSAVIRTFLAIGRGELLPELVTAPGYVRRLPVADQKKVVEGTVEAVVMKPDGTVETLKVDIIRADRKLVSQVVGRDGIRSLSEQRATIAAQVNADLATKAAKLSKRNDAPWWVDGSNVVITSGKYSRRDLQTMLNSIL